MYKSMNNIIFKEVYREKPSHEIFQFSSGNQENVHHNIPTMAVSFVTHCVVMALKLELK